MLGTIHRRRSVPSRHIPSAAIRTAGTGLIGERLLLAAFLETLRHAVGNIGGEVIAEVFDRLAVERHHAQVRLHDVRTELEERLGGLLDTRVLAREARDEDRGLAVRVELGICRYLMSASSNPAEVEKEKTYEWHPAETQSSGTSRENSRRWDQRHSR